MTKNDVKASDAVDLDEAAEQVRRLAASSVARGPSSELHVLEPVASPGKPFDQHAHDLMIKGIDQVATEWVSELEHTRENSKKVEQLVLERAAKVKADITALYLLGSAALAEAQRGDDVNERLASELDKLSEERAA
jgi:hypothetical protein